MVEVLLLILLLLPACYSRAVDVFTGASPLLLEAPRVNRSVGAPAAPGTASADNDLVSGWAVVVGTARAVLHGASTHSGHVGCAPCAAPTAAVNLLPLIIIVRAAVLAGRCSDAGSSRRVAGFPCRTGTRLLRALRGYLRWGCLHLRLGWGLGLAHAPSDAVL